MSQTKGLQAKLTSAIKQFGYWSNEVYDLNNQIQNEVGYIKWRKIHDKSKLETR